MTQLAFLTDAVFFEWPALSEFLSTLQLAQRLEQSEAPAKDAQPTESSKNLNEAARALCTSPVSKLLIEKPFMVLIKKLSAKPELYMLAIDNNDIKTR